MTRLPRPEPPIVIEKRAGMERVVSARPPAGRRRQALSGRRIAPTRAIPIGAERTYEPDGPALGRRGPASGATADDARRARTRLRGAGHGHLRFWLRRPNRATGDGVHPLRRSVGRGSLTRRTIGNSRLISEQPILPALVQEILAGTVVCQHVGSTPRAGFCPIQSKDMDAFGKRAWGKENWRRR